MEKLLAKAQKARTLQKKASENLDSLESKHGFHQICVVNDMLYTKKIELFIG